MAHGSMLYISTFCSTSWRKLPFAVADNIADFNAQDAVKLKVQRKKLLLAHPFRDNAVFTGQHRNFSAPPLRVSCSYFENVLDGRGSPLSRRGALTVLATAWIALSSPSVGRAAQSLTDKDGISTYTSDDVRGSTPITYSFEFPTGWVKKPIYPTRPSGIVVYNDNDRNAVALGIQEVPDLGSLSDLLGKTKAKELRKLARAFLRPPIDEGDEEASVKIQKTDIKTVGGRQYLYIDSVFVTTLYTSIGRAYQSRRYAFSSVALNDGRLYAVTASANDKDFNKKVEQLLYRIRDSFQVV
eukprot:CAMPEP_0184333108 /NCGR_PEP_ID=MMETSP1089-20130417/2164_1 /TAXON_ID=38269 ORGANISM="Gloeochaete wittrockiana, Strain SAG46.84" /NCGR_SAMPLE_ID=MMETSP1089 /ASSEMBLY_ACC=CAM_ASM_000445 /LENGTH=297 /DNA_ID=CAMNT_0026656763 /DNA_START=59 /DNA_END=952 /DNA_ORIENTATION=+